ncbi:peptidase P60, partial [Pseudomonas sp. MF2857]|nr:peptidase P60 [Pseudomonas sp. MF2857]
SIDTLKKPFWDKNYVIAKRVLPKEQNNNLRIVQR